MLQACSPAVPIGRPMMTLVETAKDACNRYSGSSNAMASGSSIAAAFHKHLELQGVSARHPPTRFDLLAHCDDCVAKPASVKTPSQCHQKTRGRHCCG